jgi:hypothetical protein
MLDPERELSRSPGLASDRAAVVEPATVQVGVGVSEDVPAVLGAGERVAADGELEVAVGGALSGGWLPPQATPSTRRAPRFPARKALERPMLVTEP